MHVDTDLKLGFKDVLIRPKRSNLKSRSQVALDRTYTFLHSRRVWTGVPIIAANMDTVGTFAVADVLAGVDAVLAAPRQLLDPSAVRARSRDVREHRRSAGRRNCPCRERRFRSIARACAIRRWIRGLRDGCHSPYPSGRWPSCLGRAPDGRRDPAIQVDP